MAIALVSFLRSDVTNAENVDAHAGSSLMAAAMRSYAATRYLKFLEARRSSTDIIEKSLACKSAASASLASAEARMVSKEAEAALVSGRSSRAENGSDDGAGRGVSSNDCAGGVDSSFDSALISNFESLVSISSTAEPRSNFFAVLFVFFATDFAGVTNVSSLKSGEYPGGYASGSSCAAFPLAGRMGKSSMTSADQFTEVGYRSIEINGEINAVCMRFYSFNSRRLRYVTRFFFKI